MMAIKIGVITLIVCCAFYFASLFFKKIPEILLMRIGGTIFIGLAVRIVWHYISTGAP
jgi:putative Ca2+/H+ antiporter (TMEM165/GDT1 family)